MDSSPVKAHQANTKTLGSCNAVAASYKRRNSVSSHRTFYVLFIIRRLRDYLCNSCRSMFEGAWSHSRSRHLWQPVLVRSFGGGRGGRLGFIFSIIARHDDRDTDRRHLHVRCQSDFLRVI